VTVRRGAVWAAAALLIGGASLGCSSGSNKAVGLPSITGTPTPSIPAFPKTREGAANFARYYFDALNNAESSGNTAALAASSDGSCADCLNVIDFVTRSYANGGRIEGGLVHLEAAVAAPLTDESAVVSLVVNQDDGRVLTSTGALVNKIDRLSRVTAEIGLRWSSTSWIAIRLTQFRAQQ
jgi:hypothetical protein